MASSPHHDAKLTALQVHGAVHPHPEAVIDPLFATSDFLDVHGGRDTLQGHRNHDARPLPGRHLAHAHEAHSAPLLGDVADRSPGRPGD
jgi:hypothetical protein